MTTLTIPAPARRNPAALPAKMRHAGAMKHRAAGRGGQRNEQRVLLDEASAAEVETEKTKDRCIFCANPPLKGQTCVKFSFGTGDEHSNPMYEIHADCNPNKQMAGYVPSGEYVKP